MRRRMMTLRMSGLAIAAMIASSAWVFDPAAADAQSSVRPGTFSVRSGDVPANAYEVARGMPNAQVLVIEDASHDVMGHPDVLRRSLDLFRGLH